jgi:hypothetical protein
MDPTIVMVAIIGFIAFRQWLRHQQRVMMHRERLAAIEKGMDVGPLKEDVQRSAFNTQRLLLLGGLIWLAIGVGSFIALTTILFHPSPNMDPLPQGLALVALIPIGLGFAFLIVYFVERNEARKMKR